jgi:hypothetical protein
VVNDAEDWSQSTTTVTRQRRAPESDVETTHRAVASFGGGGGPGFGHAVREFIRRYGWRAYALPILLVVTVVALLTVRSAPQAHRPVAAGDNTSATKPTHGVSSPPVAPKSIPLKSDSSGGKIYNEALKVGQLPRGRPYTKQGDGTFTVLPGHTKVFGTGGQLFRYDIEVEKGITGIDTEAYATLVDKTLEDPRSWSGHGVRLQRVSSGYVNFRVTLT